MTFLTFSKHIKVSLAVASVSKEHSFGDPLLAEMALFFFSLVRKSSIDELTKNIAVESIFLIPSHLFETKLGKSLVELLEEKKLLFSVFRRSIGKDRKDIASLTFKNERRFEQIFLSEDEKNDTNFLFSFLFTYPFDLADDRIMNLFCDHFKTICPLEIALRMAVIKERNDLVVGLIENGANPHSKNINGQNAMHLVALHNKGSGIFTFLFKNQVSIHERDKEGCTPFRRAVEKGNFLMVTVLSTFGADFREEGLVDFAFEKGHFAITKFLIQKQTFRKREKTGREQFMLEWMEDKAKTLSTYFEDPAKSKVLQECMRISAVATFFLYCY